MKLLNKEQRECLIERFNRLPPDCRTDGKHYIRGDKIKEIVDACTEKEFPTYLLNRGVTEFSICLKESTEGCIGLSISDPDWKNTFVRLPYDEFKQFAAAVNAIEDWIDDRS